MGDYFFTADTHFGHKNIMKYCNRPFSTVEEMDNEIIKKWNSVVGKKDTVFHLGDFAFGKTDEDFDKYFYALNGEIVFIKGNHDSLAWKNKNKFKSFSSGYYEATINEQLIVMCHYAMLVWNKSHYGSWELYGHCMDLETEILTNNGWKYRNDLSISDKVITLNLEKSYLEYNDIIEFIDFNYTGNIIKIESKGLNLNLTPNHVLIEPTIWKNNLQYRKYYANDFINIKKRCFIRSGILNQKGLNLKDDYLRLLVWISADGNKCNRDLIRIGLKREHKVKDMELLLNRLNLEYRKLPQKDGSFSFNFTLPSELNSYRLKPIDSRIVNCNEEQTKIIIDEYSKTDGHRYGKTTLIYTSKKEEVDIIQTMAVLNGFMCNFSERINRGFSIKPNYEISVTKKQYQHVEDTSKACHTEKVFNKPYWCIKVKNETLLIRRKGKSVVVGNSHGALPDNPNSLSIDVGVDTNNFYPYSFDDIKERMSKKIFVPIVQGDKR